MEEPEVRIKPQTGIGRDLYNLSCAPRSLASAMSEVLPKRCFAGPRVGKSPIDAVLLLLRGGSRAAPTRG